MYDQSSHKFTGHHSQAVQAKEAPLNTIASLTWQRLSDLSKNGADSNCMNLKWAMLNFKSPHEFKFYVQKLESTLTA
jgi:hypothetical protein